MKRILFLSMLVCAFTLMTSESGCDGPTNDNIRNKEQALVENNQTQLMTAVPAPDLTTSLDRINTSRRLVLFSDANKVSYIYLISYGRVMAFYTIKGKVTSSEKRLTSNQKVLEYGNGNNGINTAVVESPGLDGTYGASDSYVFFWTTDGTYVQWQGEYMLCDKPLQLATQPELIYNITDPQKTTATTATTVPATK